LAVGTLCNNQDKNIYELINHPTIISADFCREQLDRIPANCKYSLS